MLTITDLNVSYGAIEALSSVSLSVEEGDFVSIIGANGSGKSTLLKAILGLIPSEGEIKICDRNLSSEPKSELGKLIAYVPQHFTAYASFTVLEFTLLSRFPYLNRFGRFSSEDREIVQQSINDVGLCALSARALKELSGGELQRTLLASAIAQQARFILLDEFAASLDPASESEMHELISNLQSKRTLTILSTCHDVNRAALSSKSIVALKNGKIVFTGPPNELMTRKVLAEIYHGDFSLVPHPSLPELSMMLPEASR